MTDEKPKPLVRQLPKIQNRKSKIQNGITTDGLLIMGHRLLVIYGMGNV
jgi:hypothetical protein